MSASRLMTLPPTRSDLVGRIYVIGDLCDGSIFDASYEVLLTSAAAQMPPAIAADVELAVRIRHILVHKGFPNPHAVPTQRRSRVFTEAEVWKVTRMISHSGAYSAIKPRFDAVRRWLADNTPNVQFGV